MTYQKFKSLYEQTVKKLNISLDDKRRIIVTSDIHGSYPLLRRLLRQCHYTKDDYLVIVGDILERGPYCLETLRYIMNLAKCQDVLIVAGNNDYKAIEDLLYSDDASLYKYFAATRNSLLVQMCNHLNVNMSTVTVSKLGQLRQTLINSFKAEIDFILSLPHVIETEKYIFAHAGYQENYSVYQILNIPLFYELGHSFNKKLFVGHYPVSAFYHQISSYNPIIDLKRNIICLDGGNTVKDDGQLNAVIVNPDGHFEIKSVDDLEEVVAKRDYTTTNLHPTTWIWNQDEITLTKDLGDFGIYEGRSHDNLLITMKIDKNFVYTEAGKTFAFDINNYEHSAKTGDKFKLVYRYDDSCTVVKDGIRGHLPTNIIETATFYLGLAKYSDLKSILNLSPQNSKTFGLIDRSLIKHKSIKSFYYTKRLYKLMDKNGLVSSCCLIDATRIIDGGYLVGNYYCHFDYHSINCFIQLIENLALLLANEDAKYLGVTVSETTTVQKEVFKKLDLIHFKSIEIVTENNQEDGHIYFKRLNAQVDK